MAHYGIGDLKPVSSFGEEYDLVQFDYEVSAILELVGVKADYSYLFTLTHDGDFSEVWGANSVFIEYDAELLYSSDVESIRFEISHTYAAIGELAKTKRFPTRDTFMRRVESWIAENKRDLILKDVERFALYVAYSRHWITADAAFNWYGLDRDSLWIERR